MGVIEKDSNQTLIPTVQLQNEISSKERKHRGRNICDTGNCLWLGGTEGSRIKEAFLEKEMLELRLKNEEKLTGMRWDLKKKKEIHRIPMMGRCWEEEKSKRLSKCKNK